ncbi:DUF6809 family protein [Paenibacillus macerans]|uniref:DUF6809 family protein n=1 Tax=Paenibacillus macerans TaxID=44252 RepID=UPI002E1BC4A7|nr:DUF6809 family protein [Paenibacillus macerans]MED4956811.1 hypothetical protein [Paenibacillus macerans]
MKMKMSSIIEQLYNGILCPAEKIIPEDPQYRQVNIDVSETVADWKKRYSEKEFKELEALLDLYAQIHDMELTATFTCGFRLGAGLVAEILTGKNELANKLSHFPDELPE